MPFLDLAISCREEGRVRRAIGRALLSAADVHSDGSGRQTSFPERRGGRDDLRLRPRDPADDTRLVLQQVFRQRFLFRKEDVRGAHHDSWMGGDRDAPVRCRTPFAFAA